VNVNTARLTRIDWPCDKEKSTKIFTPLHPDLLPAPCAFPLFGPSNFFRNPRLRALRRPVALQRKEDADEPVIHVLFAPPPGCGQPI
jgi:hypothetical protein